MDRNVTQEGLEDYLTAWQVAERLQLSLPYIYRLAKKKDDPIPHTRIGRKIRFSRRALEKWLEARTWNGEGSR